MRSPPCPRPTSPPRLVELTSLPPSRPHRGLWIVADKRKQRLEAIADWIAHSADPQPRNRTSYHSDASDEAATGRPGGYDVVALQELWVRSDYELVAERAKQAGLIHSRFFYRCAPPRPSSSPSLSSLTLASLSPCSGAIGSGLAILSRHPIVSAFVSPYPLNGFPLHFIEGDFFAGKAVCGTTLDVDGLGKVDVLNTHMYAPGGEGDNVTGAHRVAQAWELARIATEKAERGRHVLVVRPLFSLLSQPFSSLKLTLAPLMHRRRATSTRSRTRSS